MPLMISSMKVAAAIRSKPATIFLFRVTPRGCRRRSNLEDRIHPTLSARVPSTVQGVCPAATGLTTGAVTGVIDRLEQSGFALRERDEDDRRKVLVRALPAVERRITPLFEPMQRAMSAAIAGYGEDELALLIDFLTRVHKETVAATASLQTKTSRAAKRGKHQPR